MRSTRTASELVGGVAQRGLMAEADRCGVAAVPRLGPTHRALALAMDRVQPPCPQRQNRLHFTERLTVAMNKLDRQLDLDTMTLAAQAGWRRDARSTSFLRSASTPLSSSTWLASPHAPAAASCRDIPPAPSRSPSLGGAAAASESRRTGARDCADRKTSTRPGPPCHHLSGTLGKTESAQWRSGMNNSREQGGCVSRSGSVP